ncbi:conserved hypothetical protein [Nitrobacter winogradskyi Nb-255]|uniref:Transmembrane protein n=1 Tax=Nitrobacter winogradskyi (strain ATCC 25391 / DSM 10237 / CIP 104748 / NCIMB 11846 / Nb-255) TaxID=323098 RepID=Q3SVC6_NITWN|nr:hypothetical protein [Nitrobacter winogradskyi]ABA03765.1 conserved hypothetical protein [Nitrobacter winogradskyi Nb-255]
MSVIGFPLLLIPLAICNIIVFLMPGVLLTEPVLTLTLMSGVSWTVTLGDTLLALGIVLLLFEIIKGVRPHGKYLTDHLLSLAVFGGAAAQFVVLPQFGSSTYFMLTLLALVDFLAGFALRARRPARGVLVPSQGMAEEVEAREPRAPSSSFMVAQASSQEPADPSAPAAEPLPERTIVHAETGLANSGYTETAGAKPHPDVPGPDIQQRDPGQAS